MRPSINTFLKACMKIVSHRIHRMTRIHTEKEKSNQLQTQISRLNPTNYKSIVKSHQKEREKSI